MRRNSGKAMGTAGTGALACFRHESPLALAHDYVQASGLWGMPSAGINTVRPKGLEGGGTG